MARGGVGQAILGGLIGRPTSSTHAVATTDVRTAFAMAGLASAFSCLLAAGPLSSDPSSLGAAVAVAFVSAFYSVLVSVPLVLLATTTAHGDDAEVASSPGGGAGVPTVLGILGVAVLVAVAALLEFDPAAFGALVPPGEMLLSAVVSAGLLAWAPPLDRGTPRATAGDSPLPPPLLVRLHLLSRLLPLLGLAALFFQFVHTFSNLGVLSESERTIVHGLSTFVLTCVFGGLLGLGVAPRRGGLPDTLFPALAIGWTLGAVAYVVLYATSLPIQ